ncbi:serine protease [Vibrio caribbeanicus]|uniref:serine protease n=1 Tax=Vibrio caribbeanicus TaxID=701175 RepID=UPI0030D9D4D3
MKKTATLLTLLSLLGVISFVPAVSSEPVPAQSKIIGGADANRGDWPFIVRVAPSGVDVNLGLGCGASFLGDKYILTAAHCLDFQKDNKIADPSNIDIYVGIYDLDNPTQALPVKTYYVHKDYNNNTMHNDIAIIELENSFSGPRVELQANPYAFVPNANLSVAGWGVIDEITKQTPTVLKEVKVPFVDTLTCQAAGGSYLDVDDTSFCAGLRAGGKDSCQGDSGGPIVNQDGKQVGIVSWGIGCAKPGKYGVYTNTVEFGDWIDGHSSGISYSQFLLADSRTGVYHFNVPIKNDSRDELDIRGAVYANGITVSNNSCVGVIPAGTECSFDIHVDAGVAITDKKGAPITISAQHGAKMIELDMAVRDAKYKEALSWPSNDTSWPRGGDSGGSTSLGFVLLSVLAFFTRRFK